MFIYRPHHNYCVGDIGCFVRNLGQRILCGTELTHPLNDDQTLHRSLMPLTNLTTDGSVPFAHHLSRTVSGWNALDRGWQAVLLGHFVTALVNMGLQIPW
jgi:hypothetical protein